MLLEPLHHTIVAVDVRGSGSRSDPLIVRMRADLRQMLREALGRQGVDIDQLRVDDLGDGYRLLLPALISPRAALDPFAANLATLLRLHGEASSAAARIRLRVAMHTGLLHPEPGGAWSGSSLKECARLLDAPAARWILDQVPAADLVVVVSRALFDGVVRHGYTLDPALFRRIRIQLKETDEDAWAYLPGHGLPPDPPKGMPSGSAPGPPDGEQPEPAWPRSSSVHISGDHNSFSGPIVGGDIRGR